MNAIHFEGPDFVLSKEDLAPNLLSDLLDCGGPGAADEPVAYVVRNYNVTGNPEDCAAMLRGYGAWDNEQLADHDENLARLVWLTGCGLRECGEAYFSTYA